MSKQDNNWFTEGAGFFGPDYLVEYEEILPEDRTTKEVDFVEKALDLKAGMTILDVPCGHGRHAVELGKRGYDVTGSELNEFFLQEARKTAEATGVNVRLVQGDMRELAFDSEFDVALNLFTAMGYFDTDEDDIRFLAGAHKALKPGGKFLLDFMNRNWLIRNFKEKDWRDLPDGSKLLIEREFDDIHGYNRDRRTKIKKGEEKTMTTSLRIYTPNELVRMAESVGFTFEESFGNFDGDPLTLNSRRIILWFSK